MSGYRTLLAHLSDDESATRVLHVASQLALSHGAALRAVRAVESPNPGAYLSPEMSALAAQLNFDAEREGVAAARDRVAHASLAHGLAIEFQSLAGEPVQGVSALTRVADLAVVSQPGAGRLPFSFASRLLVTAGCPLLFVPSVGELRGTPQRVLVAWSGSREGARALRDALPLLQRAAAVELLRFGSHELGLDEPLEPVLTYLKAHGVPATCSVQPVREISFGERMLNPTAVDASVAELLLSHAADSDADVLVMGGYGHTRAFELVMGGVSRTMLHSMTVPVLMSH